MAFVETRFPVGLSYGSSGGPSFRTIVVPSDSGHDVVQSRWQRPLYEYDAAYAVKSFDDLTEVLKFWIARKGRANGFRFKDWFDYTTADNGRDAPTSVDQTLGTGDGAITQFQLIKRYEQGGSIFDRTLEKPVEGQVFVSLDDTPQASGWTVDTTTGLITFTAAPGAGVVVKAGCEFDVPCRFGDVPSELFNVSMDAFDVANIPPIPIVEIRNPAKHQSQFFYGGSQTIESADNIQVSVLKARVYVITMTAAGRKVLLPDPVGLPDGGPFFYIVNAGAETFDVRDNADTTTIATLTTDQTVEVALATDSASNRIWIGF